MQSPKIIPIKLTEYAVKQSKYGDIVPKLPIRAMICAPSGSGKTVLLASMCLDIYRGCFNRIFVFSPSCDIDQTWEEVRKYIDHELMPKTQKDEHKEQTFFSEYDPAALQHIMNTQFKIVKYQKDQGITKLFQILIIIDDFADSPEFTRSSTLLHQLYIRGRHSAISTITSTQVYKQVSPLIRKNISHIFVFRLRNQADLEGIIEEMSAVYDKKILYQIYKTATDTPFSFLYINLMTQDKSEMFFKNFEEKIIPN